MNLAGIKTYVVALVAILFAWLSFFFPDTVQGIPGMTLQQTIETTLVALAAMGLRSGIASGFQTLLLAQGIDLPKSPTADEVRAAVDGVIDFAKSKGQAAIAVLALSAVLLGGCGTFGGGIIGNSPQQQFEAVVTGFQVAEASYNMICSVNRPPAFCTDADNAANYSKAKQALLAAINTAQAAIAAAGGLNTATVTGLISALYRDWATFNNIVKTAQTLAPR